MPRQHSNPQSLDASSRRPTPQTSRPLVSEVILYTQVALQSFAIILTGLRSAKCDSEQRVQKFNRLLLAGQRALDTRLA